ncbi:molybdopterin cofactor-binding domain-containing protein [Thalassiella azotivora]
MRPHRTRLPAATVTGGVGASATRPDGRLKVTGAFAFASDAWVEGMLWGATLRSPHPHARIRRLDTSRALAAPGVLAALTHQDVPGQNRYGLERRDQPVLAEDLVRYQGEPVAVVAADQPETARRALDLVDVDYEVLTPRTDPQAALQHTGEPLHPDGDVVRHVRIRKGDPVPAAGTVVVEGEYDVGMQDQAPLGPESGLAVPAEDGGVDLHVATQWLHADRDQVAHALGLAPDLVRITLAGVGGAFGAREDLSVQVHAAMLALRTGRPVRMVYGRQESFVGHVHRHPARLRYRHTATADGRLLSVAATIVLDGGAYASSTPAVVANAATLGAGPYRVDHVQIDCWGVRTNNPPCGAMRGFGAVQAAFAYESQMDRLAAAVGLDPVEVRIRNALTEGDTTAAGQALDSPAPVAELLRRVRDLPLPPPPAADPRTLPGGVAGTTRGEGVVRGVGYGVGIKNVCFSEGFDDSATVRLRLELLGGEPVAEVRTAAAEVGQGLVTVLAQVVRTELGGLGVERVVLAPADTTVASAGSTSASRQTYVTGGATRAACERVRAVLAARCPDPLQALAAGPVDETVTWRHRPTTPLDPATGQGRPHVQLAFAAHRAVVDVDTELGLVKVVALDCAQDVGFAVNPQAVLGQVHGGSVQGLGLAVMEELQVHDGAVLNASFTDYLLPTVLDVPPMRVELLEHPDPHAPYGLRGVGEPPTLSSTPAVVAAIRDATGLALTRVPVRPEHLTGT